MLPIHHLDWLHIAHLGQGDVQALPADKMIEVWQSDCRQLLPRFNGQVNLLFADPPYAISNERNVKNDWNGYTSFKGDWDEVGDYESFTDSWVPLACQTLVPGGIILVSGLFGSLVPVWRCLERVGMKFQSHIAWHKTNPAPSVQHRMLTNANEFVLCFSNGPRWQFNYKRAKELAGRDPHNVIDCPVARRQAGIISKPLKLMTFLVECFTSPGDLVLDPFAGTGSTLVAAAQLKRRAVGVDVASQAIDAMKLRFGKEGLNAKWQRVPA